MHIRVTDGGATVEGARLTLRFARPDAAPYYAQVLTDAKGDAEMSVQVDENSLSDSSVVVQVSFAGRPATRQLQLPPAIRTHRVSRRGLPRLRPSPRCR